MHSIQYIEIKNFRFMDENINNGIRAMLIDLIDQIIQRPLSAVILEDEQKNPFVSLKNELESKAPMTLNQFRSPIQNFFSDTKSNDSVYISNAAIVLERYFEKKFNIICSFSNYNFKDILLEAAKKTFPEIESFTQVSNDSSVKKEEEAISIPHRGKKNSKSIRIEPNEKTEATIDDEHSDKNDKNDKSFEE